MAAPVLETSSIQVLDLTLSWTQGEPPPAVSCHPEGIPTWGATISEFEGWWESEKPASPPTVTKLGELQEKIASPETVPTDTPPNCGAPWRSALCMSTRKRPPSKVLPEAVARHR